jgi:hypothetical protein
MLFVGPPIFGFSPLIFPRKDQLRLILLLQVLKPLRLMKIRTEMKPKDLWRRDSTTSPPPAISEDRDLEKKRKREGRGFLEYLRSERSIRGDCFCQGL